MYKNHATCLTQTYVYIALDYMYLLDSRLTARGTLLRTWANPRRDEAMSVRIYLSLCSQKTGALSYFCQANIDFILEAIDKTDKAITETI